MHLTLDLWSHQVKMHNYAVNLLKKYGYCFWFAGCATGKTLASYQVMATGNFRRTLVLTTKAAMLGAWKKDFEHVSGAKLLTLDTGNSKQKSHKLRELCSLQDDAKNTEKIVKPLIVVVNYESARLIADTIESAQFDFAIADESHRLKSYNSKQSLVLAEACAKIPYKLCMTGTAWSDSPLDIYGQYRWLSPDLRRRGLHASTLFGHYLNDFRPRYAKLASKDNIQFVVGYKNLEELEERVSSSMVKIATEDVRDLPPYMDIIRNVRMSKSTRKYYEEIKNEGVALVDDEIALAENPFTMGMRLHQLTCGFITTESGELKELPKETAKLDELKAIVEEIGGKPFVVFTRFRRDVQRIKTYLKHLKLHVLTGDTNESEEFQAGSGDGIIVNISAGAEGIDLSRASKAIYYSFDYSRNMYEQSRWRVRRHNTPEPIAYYHILMEKSIDQLIYNALQGKGDIAQLLTNSLTLEVKINE